MTVSTNTPRIAHTANGTTTAFAVPFQFFAAADLRVYVAASATATPALRSTGVSVSGGSGAAGTVTFASPPAAGSVVTIIRNTAALQQASWADGVPFPAAAVEQGLDRAVMLIQEAQATAGRALALPAPETGVNALPPAAQRAGKFLCFDASGAPVMGTLGAYLPLSGGRVQRDTACYVKLALDDGDADLIGGGPRGSLRAYAATAAGLAGTKNGWQANYFEVHEGVRQIDGAGGATATKVDGLRVVHYLDQASGGLPSGGRHAGQFNFVQTVRTDAASTDRNYVGLCGQAITYTGDGGTSTAQQGAYFGGNFYAAVRGAANWVLNLTGAEFNTETAAGAQVWYQSGLQIASLSEARGFGLDTAIAVGQQPGAYGWGNGITFTNKNGRNPLDSDSVVMSFDHGCTIRDGLNFRSVTFTGSILATPTVDLRPASLGIAGANAAIGLGAATMANTPALNLLSSGFGNAYDVQLLASGGANGQSGKGVLTISAATAILPSDVRLTLSADATGYPRGRLYRDANGFVKVVM